MNISVSSQTTLLNSSNYFVFALYDASAPSVLLESQQPPKPYGDPIQVTFLYNCVKGNIYIIKLWESADDTPTGVVRNSMSQAVNAYNVNVRLPEYYQVGIDSGWVAGATSVIDTSWAGWDYWIVRNPNIMIPDYTTNSDPNYHKVDTGGFNLIQDGDSLQPDEKFEVFFVPQVSTDNSGPLPFTTGRVITADTTLTNSDKGQALLLQSATSNITITMPALSATADFDFFYIFSAGGSHKNASIIFPGTDKVNFNGSLRSALYLGQSELLKVFKAFGNWQVENSCPGILQVGEFIYDYSLVPLNTLFCDGSVYNRADYPRLWEFITQLASGLVVTDSAWTDTFITVDGIDYYTKSGLFSTGNGSTTFRLPKITSNFMRPVDGISRLAGTFEVQNIQPHYHDDITGDNTSHASASSSHTGDVQLLVNNSGPVAQGTVTNSKTGAVHGIGSNVETKPSNNGAYVLIRI